VEGKSDRASRQAKQPSYSLYSGRSEVLRSLRQRLGFKSHVDHTFSCLAVGSVEAAAAAVDYFKSAE